MDLKQWCWLLVAGVVLPASAWSADRLPEEGALFGVPLADEELDQLRGGFLQDGLEIAIGLDQIVSIDGQEMIVNRLTIPNLNQQMRGRGVDHTVETVVQILKPDSSGGSRVATNLGNGTDGWTTVIQNTLNDTVIQNIHQLNIELNNLGDRYRVPQHLGDHLNHFLSR
ncbi:hypothetical protein [Marinobacter sp. OP 3.4]|uniref:hypothetical protein n=1 Tax=Marinobacter sp. OP 3.4 TaxID=3076501 RepID=UPI002E24DDD2